jgi:hypothetical protein
MKRFFNILAVAMIVLLGVAVAVVINHFQPMEQPANKPSLNASGSMSKGGLPADYYDLVKSARDDEGQACDAASNAFGAADNANREAKTAEEAADEAGAKKSGYGAKDEAVSKACRKSDGTVSQCQTAGHYQGELVDGVQEGSGVENYDDGSWYKGRWEKGKYTLGVYKSNSGERYAGEFEGGQRSGNGVVTETNGSVFSGQWSKGSPSGYGELKGGTDDSFAMVLGQFNDNSDSRVVVRNKNGEEWIKVEKHSKAEGPCVQMDSSERPVVAGQCLDEQLDKAEWRKDPNNLPDAFVRDHRCSG